jgi:hypothetical protein
MLFVSLRFVWRKEHVGVKPTKTWVEADAFSSNLGGVLEDRSANSVNEKEAIVQVNA